MAAYVKTTWADGATPISALNMNKIEQRLFDLKQLTQLCADNGTAITITGLDLNTVIATGFYEGSGLINAPTAATWHYVEVIQHINMAGYAIQIAYPLGVNSPYIRQSQNSVWSAWTKVLTPADRGIANGVAPLDASNLVPTTHLGNVISAINTSSIVWELLATKTSATDFTSADFTSIPAYNTYRIIAHVKSSDVNVRDLSIRFNGIMTTHSAWTNNNGVITSVLNSSDIVFTGAVKDYGAPYGTNIVDILISNHNPAYHTIMGSTSYEGKFLQLDGTWDYNATINRMTISSLFDSDSIIKLFGSKSLV